MQPSITVALWTAMKQDLSEAAAWLMDHLMLGVGVGFRISRIRAST
jgi:hypothetical protein